MNSILVKYLAKEKDGYYKGRNAYLLKGVSCSSDRTRNMKATNQASLDPIPFSKVYSYINDFLELIREDM